MTKKALYDTSFAEVDESGARERLCKIQGRVIKYFSKHARVDGRENMYVLLDRICIGESEQKKQGKKRNKPRSLDPAGQGSNCELRAGKVITD